MLVLEIDPVDVEGFDQISSVLDPHGGTVEVDQHPFVGVHVKGVCHTHPFHQMPVFRTAERRSSVSRVHMQPDIFLVANLAELFEVVEGAGSGCP